MLPTCDVKLGTSCCNAFLKWKFHFRKLHNSPLMPLSNYIFDKFFQFIWKQRQQQHNNKFFFFTNSCQCGVSILIFVLFWLPWVECVRELLFDIPIWVGMPVEFGRIFEVLPTKSTQQLKFSLEGAALQSGCIWRNTLPKARKRKFGPSYSQNSLIKCLKGHKSPGSLTQQLCQNLKVTDWLTEQIGASL